MPNYDYAYYVISQNCMTVAKSLKKTENMGSVLVGMLSIAGHATICKLRDNNNHNATMKKSLWDKKKFEKYLDLSV